jgi:hypothetical protein
MLSPSKDGAAGYSSSPWTSDSIPLRLGVDVAVPLASTGGALVEEPSVAVRDSLIVVSWNDSHGGHRIRGYHDIGSAVSVNRGRSFRNLPFLPDSTEGHLPVGGDSRVVADENGRFFLETLGDNTGGGKLVLVYELAPPAYASWRELAVVTTGSISTDKPAFIRDARGRLILAFTLDSAIVVSMSEDSGHSWSRPRPVSTFSRRPRSGTAVVSCGDELWTAWTDTRQVPWDEVWAARSSDAGRTFDAPSLVHPFAHTVASPRGYSLGPGPNSLIQNDVGLSCSRRGTSASLVQLTTIEGVLDADNRPVLSRVLRFERSPSAGTWSGPLDMTARDEPATRVFPSVATTASTTGTLYYEHRLEGTHSRVDAILIVEDAQGRRSRVRVSDQSTDWLSVPGDLVFAPGQSNFGDYISLASDGAFYVAAWTDGRDGRSRIHVRTIEPIDP